MSEHFIKNIEIKNFKCFEDFKAEGFGRVNLIGGKNNVGKTAFMEAVCINTHTIDIQTLFTSITFPNFIRYKLEMEDINNLKPVFERTLEYYSKSNIQEVSYFCKNNDGRIEYNFRIDDKEVSVNANEFSYQLKRVTNIYFMDNLGYTNYTLKEVYMALQRLDKEEVLNQYINQFDSSIEKFKIFDGSPECKLKNVNKYRKINEFGDGLKHYISIICSLYACENGYLFIDEIDNGIHYTQLDRLWEIILTISKQQNVQVFATTHSKECIESYVRVAKKLEDEEIRFIELGRDNDKITPIVYEYDEIINQVEQHQDIRGW